MNEDLGKEMAIEAAKAVAVEGYKDTLQPTLKTVGGIIALPFQAIDAALSKPKLWVAEKHYNYERTLELLHEKLKNTPEEQIVPPENYVAIPALQQISYCFDSDELRDMYANLLANSMNKVVKNGVHPGFVEIIKQLSPDEAKMLRYLYKNPLVPTIAIKVYKKPSGMVIVQHLFTNIMEICKCENPNGYEKAVDNLLRLGLVKLPDDESLTDKSQYEQLKNHPYILNKKKYLEALENVATVDFIEGHIELTAFGRSFCDICLSTQNVITITVDDK